METNIELFRSSGKIQICLTTDILARDFYNRGISLVINMDMPIIYENYACDTDTYLHRIGRCARFGDAGNYF